MRDGVLEAGGAAMGRRGRDAVPMSDEKVSDEKVNVGIGMGEMRNKQLIAVFECTVCGVGMVLGRGRVVGPPDLPVIWRESGVGA